jgi:hypothetical protein
MHAVQTIVVVHAADRSALDGHSVLRQAMQTQAQVRRGHNRGHKVEIDISTISIDKHEISNR